MYRPAPVRRRKTSIVRSRSGCGTCRRRRKKCDEKKPVCGTCQKLGKRCDYETNLEFRQVSFPSSQLRSESTSTPAPSGLHPAPSEMTHPQRTPPMSAASSRTHLSTSDPASADFDNPQDLWIPVDDHCELVHRALTNHTVDLSAGDCLELQIRGPMHGPSSQALIGDSYAVEQTYDLEDFSHLPISPHPGNSTSQPQGSKSSDSHRLMTGAQFNHQTVINMPDSLMFLSRQLFYLTAWQDRCSPALPPILEQFDNFESLQPVVSEAMAALSACRLSRLNPHKDHDASRQLYYRPNLSHRIASQESYCSAIKGVVSWRPLDGYPDATIILRVLLLFCCLETAMGNFRGFQLHSRGVVKLAENGIESIIAVDRARGIKLLQAWAQIKMHNWWLRFHFSTQQFLSSDVGFRLEPPLQVFLPVAETRRTSVLGILCESYRLSSLIHMHRWNKTELMGAATPSRDTRASLEALLSETIAGNKHALKEQSQILDTWHSLVARSDLPFDSFGDARPSVGGTCSGLDVKPLYFTSHTAAMNYAYYATARIAQSGCGAQLVELSTMATKNDLRNESSPWAMLLLRIVAGIDWEECIRLNPFTIGISSLLLVCSLRCSDPEISIWIQSWIEERFVEQSSEEGSFPISQILRSLRLINRERGSGIDVVAIFTPVEDGGGRGKYDSYESQTLTVVSTICRKREDNSYTLLKRSF